MRIVRQKKEKYNGKESISSTKRCRTDSGPYCSARTGERRSCRTNRSVPDFVTRQPSPNLYPSNPGAMSRNKRRIRRRGMPSVDHNGNTSVFGLRIRLTVTIDVSVRWVQVFLSSAISYCLQCKESLMDSISCLVLFGAALLPVSG
jgi:hypothetical protein